MLRSLAQQEDFYDFKVTQAEGFSKAKLFSILDTLLEGSKDLLAAAREKLAADKGAAALEGWNTGFMMAGDVEKRTITPSKILETPIE